MRYQAAYSTIDTETYRQLRVACGLSPKTAEAATAALPRSVCSVTITDSEQQDAVVGMGHIIGDGACFCQIVDICVLPDHQKQGLGKLIMEKLMAFVQTLPVSCYISLIADGEAYRLYEQYGFSEVYPRSRGMGLVR